MAHGKWIKILILLWFFFTEENMQKKNYYFFTISKNSFLFATFYILTLFALKLIGKKIIPNIKILTFHVLCSVKNKVDNWFTYYTNFNFF